MADEPRKDDVAEQERAMEEHERAAQEHDPEEASPDERGPLEPGGGSAFPVQKSPGS